MLCCNFQNKSHMNCQCKFSDNVREFILKPRIDILASLMRLCIHCSIKCNIWTVSEIDSVVYESVWGFYFYIIFYSKNLVLLNYIITLALILAITSAQLSLTFLEQTSLHHQCWQHRSPFIIPVELFSLCSTWCFSSNVGVPH